MAGELETLQSLKEKIIESFETHEASTATADELYCDKLKALMEKYKDNPTMLEKQKIRLKDWYDKGEWERLI